MSYIPNGNGIYKNSINTNNSGYNLANPRAGLQGGGGQARFAPNNKGTIMFGLQSYDTDFIGTGKSKPKQYASQSTQTKNPSIWGPLFAGLGASVLGLGATKFFEMLFKTKSPEEETTSTTGETPKGDDKTKPTTGDNKTTPTTGNNTPPAGGSKPAGRKMPEINPEVQANTELTSNKVTPWNRYNIDSTKINADGSTTSKGNLISNNHSFQSIMLGNLESQVKMNKFDSKAVASMVANQFKYDKDGDNTLNKQEFVNSFKSYATEHDSKMQSMKKTATEDVSLRYQPMLEQLQGQKAEAQGKIDTLTTSLTKLGEAVTSAETGLQDILTQLDGIDAKLADPNISEADKTALTAQKKEIEANQPKAEQALVDAKKAEAQAEADIKGYQDAITDIENRISEGNMLTAQAEADVEKLFDRIAGEDGTMTESELNQYFTDIMGKNVENNVFDPKLNKKVSIVDITKKEIMDDISSNPFGSPVQ